MDLVVVTGNSTGRPQWTEASNVAFANNGTVTVTDTWHPLAHGHASYTNAPAFCADTTNTDYPCNVQLARYVPELHGNRCDGTRAITRRASLMVTSPTSSAAIMQTQLTTNGPEYQIFTDVVDGTQTSYAIDFAARSLPWMCRKTAQCPMFSGTTAKLDDPGHRHRHYDLFETDVQWTRAASRSSSGACSGRPRATSRSRRCPRSVATMNPTAQRSPVASRTRGSASPMRSSGWRAARQNPFDALATCPQSTNPTAPRYAGMHDRLSASQ